MGNAPPYENRGQGRDCVRFGTPGEDCWGRVIGSSRGLECLGHAGGGRFLSPQDVEAQRLEDLRRHAETRARLAAEEKARKEAWEANRWFRPLLERASAIPASSLWTKFPEDLLLVLFSALGAGHDAVEGSEKALQAIQDAALPVIAEVQRRGKEWPVGPYLLRLGSRLKDPGPRLPGGWFPMPRWEVTPDLVGDQDLQVWQACVSLALDYSLLDAQTRHGLCDLHDAFKKALSQRGLGEKELSDLEGPR